MKTIKSIASILTLACVTFTSCEEVDNPTNELKTITLSRSEADVAKQNCDFAWNMFDHVNKTSGNAIVSPLSATYAMCMTANGANGATRDEIYKALGFEDFSNEDVNNYLHKLTTQLTSLDSKTTLHIANSLWHNSSYQILNEYISSTKTYYDADVMPLDVNNAVTQVNDWCSTKTNGLINDLLKPNQVDEFTAAVLVNAMYFDGEWKNKFNKKATYKSKFYCADNSTPTVEYMSGEQDFKYVNTLTFSMASLDFGNGAFTLKFILPNKNYTTDGEYYTFDDCINEIKTTGWNEISKKEYSEDGTINIPKFSFKNHIDMKPIYQEMGIISAFNSSADFSNMSTYPFLLITSASQSNYFEIDEDGATAASASSTVTGDLLAIAPFTLNRPFIFALTEQSTGAILFIGKVEKFKPTILK